MQQKSSAADCVFDAEMHGCRKRRQNSRHSTAGAQRTCVGGGDEGVRESHRGERGRDFAATVALRPVAVLVLMDRRRWRGGAGISPRDKRTLSLHSRFHNTKLTNILILFFEFQ